MFEEPLNDLHKSVLRSSSSGKRSYAKESCVEWSVLGSYDDGRS